MKFIICCVFLVLSYHAFSQGQKDSISLDDKYLEDQFYAGITYNFLLSKPQNVTQRNLSYGIFGGFIKDMPLNEGRTRALGIGLGYALNSYYSNLQVSETPDGFGYSVLGSEVNFKRSKIETHLIELPLELRWRNSTAAEYKFWRIYGGAKLGYVIGGRSKFVSASEKYSFYNTDIRKFQYGLTLNFGYNTFNVHLYYSLNDLFNNDVSVDGELINMKTLRVGIIFYIL